MFTAYVQNVLTSQHLSKLFMGQNLLSLVGSGCPDGEHSPTPAEQNSTLLTSYNLTIVLLEQK